MRRFAILAILAALGTAQAAAQVAGRSRTAKPEPKKPNPCAVHGPGFVMLPGTTTCVRLGGSAEGDLSVGRGSAPNLGVK